LDTIGFATRPPRRVGAGWKLKINAIKKENFFAPNELMSPTEKFLSALAVCASIAVAQTPVDLALPSYKKTSGISGNLSCIGSDTMSNLMTYWAEEFKKIYPSVNIQIEGKGSSTAPPALITRTAQFGPMSRSMKDTEIDQFENTFGYKPIAFRAAIDAVAVYVNKDNPLRRISMKELDAVFSSTRRGRHGNDITKWGQLGLTGVWKHRPISLYGRNSASGTYGYFKEHALFKGDFKSTVKEQPGSAAVVHGVAGDLSAIGYSGIGYVTSGVRWVLLSSRGNEDAVAPNLMSVLDGKYPLSRFLLVYVNKKPDKPFDPLVKEFLRFMFSREGQQIVMKYGYMPVPARIAREELAKLP
jgi:phosphate transport system substrate-binding protein